MANGTPKKGVIRRLTAKLKKGGGSDKRIQLSDFPQEKCPEQVPERLEMDVLVKWSGKVKPRNRSKKQRAILDRGQLELRDRNKPETVGLACGYTIDLAKVTVYSEDKRLLISFPTDSTVAVTTGDQASADRLKEAVNKHRLYRQEIVQRDPKAGAPTDSLVSTTDDFKHWDWDPSTSKVFESIRDMQSLSLAVLEKSTKCLEELKTVAEDLRVFCGEKPAVPKTAEKEKIAKAVTSRSAVTSQSKTSQQEEEDDETDDSPELDEETEKQLLTPVPAATPMLLSLESAREDPFEQQSKRDVMARCEKILSKASPDISAKKVLAPKKEAAKVEPKKATAKGKRARREVLPKMQLPGESIGFKALYQLLVNKTGMPLTNYEPIGIVQATCEELLWSTLLDQAASKSSAEERMSLVTAFAMSSYLTKSSRYRKPFNPILGETFDYEEAGWKFHGEQVSHHPAITAGYAESSNWSYYITFHLETSIGKLSRCLELSMDEPLRVRLKLADGTSEDYVWHKVKTKIENLTSTPEQRKITHEGTLCVRSTTGYTGRIFFKKHRNPMEITGDVVSPNDRLCYRLSGYWDKNLVRIRTTGEREYLLNGDQLKTFPDYFGFSPFTMGLNEPDTGLPTSDSRNRMDMRALEEGNLVAAAKHKRLLEEHQRARNRANHKPLWFESVRDDASKKMIYFPNNKYWEAKCNGFADVKDIVNLDTDT